MNIKEDLWSSEEFENRITAATVALYESATDSECDDRHSICRFNAGDLIAIRKHGIYITAPDREIFAPGIGISVLKWPLSGCVSFGAHYKESPNEDLVESYCRIVYFKRLNRLPSHSSMISLGDPYQLISVWPQNSGPVVGITDYMTVNRRTGVVSRTIPAWHSKDPAKVLRYTSDEEKWKQEYALSAAIQFTEDSRHLWTITAHNDVSKVTVGAHAESVKSLLYARDLPITITGRKRPILHIVHAHRRRISAGTDIDVRDFLRGTREVVMNETRYTVSAPATVIEELVARKSAQ